jgi:hypothetical protein
MTLRFGGVFLCAICVSLPGCDPSDAARPAQVDDALARATRFLFERQSPDGAWRSEVYGAFKEGDALTPLVLQALLRLPPSEQRNLACRRGADYLARMVGADGSIDPGRYGLTYPVHTAAAAVIGFGQPETANLRARDAWLTYLRQRQLTEALGWQPADPSYGGWGYAKDLPRKPAPGVPISPMLEANLSATISALDAFRAAGCSPEDAAIQKALRFVERCQNFSTDPAALAPRFDDGGFFFVHDDAGRNKAGVAGKDGHGHERYFSYGSTTADGLRALFACGLPATHPRVKAAGTWLERHFRPDQHPGTYTSDREVNRPALFYYYCASVAQALHGAHADSALWSDRLAAALVDRQQADGSWRNPAVDVREDDPLVATPLAIVALSYCKATAIR